MKFFLEFVPCCGSIRRELTGSVPPTAAEGEEEETQRLVTQSRRHRRWKERGRSGSVSGAVEWRPSLGAISEDNVIAEKPEKQTVTTVKSKTAYIGSRSRVHDRINRDNYCQASYPTIMPAFSPTAFMF